MLNPENSRTNEMKECLIICVVQPSSFLLFTEDRNWYLQKRNKNCNEMSKDFMENCVAKNIAKKNHKMVRKYVEMFFFHSLCKKITNTNILMNVNNCNS